MSGQRHHVEMFQEHGHADWGWQCFTCGAEDRGFPSLLIAESHAIEHEDESARITLT